MGRGGVGLVFVCPLFLFSSFFFFFFYSFMLFYYLGLRGWCLGRYQKAGSGSRPDGWVGQRSCWLGLFFAVYIVCMNISQPIALGVADILNDDHGRL